MFTLFCSIFIKQLVYQISSASPNFYTRYYKKRSGLFSGQCRIYSVSQKSSPPKTFYDIFTYGEPV